MVGKGVENSSKHACSALFFEKLFPPSYFRRFRRCLREPRMSKRRMKQTFKGKFERMRILANFSAQPGEGSHERFFSLEETWPHLQLDPTSTPHAFVSTKIYGVSLGGSRGGLRTWSESNPSSRSLLFGEWRWDVLSFLKPMNQG